MEFAINYLLILCAVVLALFGFTALYRVAASDGRVDYCYIDNVSGQTGGYQVIGHRPWRSEEIVGASKDEVVLISENAERVILDALYETREDLRAVTMKEFPPEDEADWRSRDWLKVRQKGTNHSH